MYDKIWQNSILCYNNTALSVTDLHKLKKEIPSWFCVSHAMKLKTKEICRCQCSFEGISSFASKKISKEMICRFSESRNVMWHMTRRKATVSTGPHVMNSVAMPRVCSSRHAQVSFILSKSWHPIARLCSMTNVQDISAHSQNTDTWAKQTSSSSKKLQVSGISEPAGNFIIDFLQVQRHDLTKQALTSAYFCEPPLCITSNTTPVRNLFSSNLHLLVSAGATLLKYREDFGLISSNIWPLCSFLWTHLPKSRQLSVVNGLASIMKNVRAC